MIFLTAFLFFVNRIVTQMVFKLTERPILPKVPRPKIYQPLITDYTPNKSILYWDTFFGQKDMGLGLGSDIFRSCPVATCFTTNNRSFMPIESFDAIIFHGARYSSQSSGLPSKRNVNQKYVFFSLESPYNTHFDPLVSNDFYNWTMTYRKDSDIHYPYKLVQEILGNYSVPDIEEIRKKTKMIAWFVSNCATLGSKRRMKFAMELNKYIPVDIYGSCGNLTCSFTSNCYKMLEENYKFYLSFENSMCSDYVTEKLFNVLEYNVVPIVLGHADYSSIAPPDSVIDANDFDSPRALAHFLLDVADNYEDYVRYFQWKKNFGIFSSEEYVLCQLCEMLNIPLDYTSYADIEDWFYGFKCFL